MSIDFNIKTLESELNMLIDEFKNNENFKYNPRNCFERIFSKLFITISNKKTPISALASITNTTVNGINTLRVIPFEKANARYIESALSNECNAGLGDRVEKDGTAFIIYLPVIITQQHIDTIVKILFKPIVETYLHVKLKEIRTKYHEMIKSMQTKQRDLFIKYRDQIDTETSKYTKKINDIIVLLEKKYNIKI